MEFAITSAPRSGSPARKVRNGVPGLMTLLVLAAATMSGAAFGADAAFASKQDNRGAFLPSPVQDVSTVPSNGDVNPYGVAFVPAGFNAGAGSLKRGDVLVSNFNNSDGLQGTGTTIVDIVPATGTQSVFFQGTAPLGLTTALGVLRKGFVIVGNGPTVDGSFATASAGSLLVIDNEGHLRQTITDPTIQYPWDMTLVDSGSNAIAFVSNALNGTVTRLVFSVGNGGLTLNSAQVIASGYQHRPDPAALVVAPTGLVYDRQSDVLFVASTEDNEIFAVRNAAKRTSSGGTGTVIYQDNDHLHGPLALAQAPNGHLLVSNGDAINGDPSQPSEIVEFTTGGHFVTQLSVDPVQGSAFGLAVQRNGNTATLAAVDDNTNSLLIWQINLE